MKACPVEDTVNCTWADFWTRMLDTAMLLMKVKLTADGQGTFCYARLPECAFLMYVLYYVYRGKSQTQY
jgi:hypothetical protein